MRRLLTAEEQEKVREQKDRDKLIAAAAKKAEKFAANRRDRAERMLRTTITERP